MRYNFRRYLSSDLSRNILTLMSGTVLSQAIPLLFSVILARVYAPELYGAYFVFLSLLSIGLIFATGKFELAILIANDDEEALSLLNAAAFTAVFVCIFLLVIVVLFMHSLSNMLNFQGYGLWLFFVPLSLLLSSVNEVFYYWHNRHKRYRILANAKILQSSVSSILQLILGLTFANSGGLIYGLMCGQFISLVFLYYHIRVFDSEYIKIRFVRDFRKTATRFIRFPRDIASAALVTEIGRAHV